MTFIATVADWAGFKPLFRDRNMSRLTKNLVFGNPEPGGDRAEFD